MIEIRREAVHPQHGVLWAVPAVAPKRCNGCALVEESYARCSLVAGCATDDCIVIHPAEVDTYKQLLVEHVIKTLS